MLRDDGHLFLFFSGGGYLGTDVRHGSRRVRLDQRAVPPAG